MEEPRFPLLVRYDTGEETEVESLEVARLTLEWFDSDNPKNGACVYDASGREVSLKIEALEIVRFQFRDQPGDSAQ